ncbi:MAG: MerR family transcriptional regulator [Myxococcales bacterium]|jgi:DNA-binding transcriptional MerR regulator
MADRELPDKLFFKIGEVAQIVGVKPHVLRYWESEFAALKPMKTRGSHRVYRRRDVELAVLLRRLLQDEGFTIAGAKKRLRELGRDRVSSEPDPEAVREVGMRADLLTIRAELSDLLQRIDKAVEEPQKAGDRQVKATVTASVPSTVPIRPRSR